MNLRHLLTAHRATVLRVSAVVALFALAFIVSAYVGRGSTLGFLGALGGCGLIALWVTRGFAPAARALLAAGLAVGIAGALFGMAFGDAAFPNYLVAVGIVLFAAAILADAADWARIKRALRFGGDIVANRYGLRARSFVVAAVVVLGLSAVAVFAATAAPSRIWPFEIVRFAAGAHRAYGNPTLLRFGVILDALLGALAVYALVRPRHGRGAALFAAVLWTVIGPRMAIVWLLPLPTFVIPAFAYVFERFLAQRSRAIVVVAAIVGVSALFSPALALAQLGVALAMAVAARETRALVPVIIGLVVGAIGCALHLVPHPTLASMVSPGLDRGLRMSGADGSWPWETLYPAVDAAFLQSLTPAILTGVGRGGNVLVMSFGIGWGLLVLAAAAWCATPRASSREPQWWLAGLIALGLGLPSHAYGVPLPTPSEFVQAVGGSAIWTPVAAKLLLAFAVTMLAGGLVARIARGGNPVLLPIAALLLFAVPATGAFSIDTQTAPSSASLADAARLGSPLVIAPSYERDDWAWRYAAYASRRLDRRLSTLDAVATVPQSRRAPAPAALLVEDPATARAQPGGPFRGLAIVPAAFEAPSTETGPRTLTACIGGYSLVRLFPSQAVYARKPACRP